MSRLHVFSILILSTLLLLGSLPAGAGKHSKHSAKRSSSVSLSPAGSSSDVASEKIPTQPIETCLGSSDRPHDSGHVNGTVNAQGKTSCPRAFPTIYVFSELYKDGNFIQRTQAYANNKDRTIATTNVNMNCPKNPANFRINSYHYVVWPDFDQGAGNTWNSAKVECKKK